MITFDIKNKIEHIKNKLKKIACVTLSRNYEVGRSFINILTAFFFIVKPQYMHIYESSMNLSSKPQKNGKCKINVIVEKTEHLLIYWLVMICYIFLRQFNHHNLYI